jgi:acid phosphatase
MLSLLALPLLLAALGPKVPAPHVAHVTVVLMENRNYDNIVGSPDMPYLNNVLIAHGALLTNSHAVSHPSEPNYLALFSGSTHGITSDACPLTFSTQNLGSELIAAGKTFVGYAESMPQDGFMGCRANGLYARKHDPWVNFDNVPPSDNVVYHGLPVSNMPTVDFLVPNLCNDMHDCSARQGDDWLAKNLPPIVAWNAKNAGLLIITWDEADPDTGNNHIPTVLVGPMVKPGSVDKENVDHYGVLRTIESFFSLPCIDQDCRAAPIAGIWQ